MASEHETAEDFERAMNPAPYTVQVDKEGCPHCGQAKSFMIVGPDDVATSTSYTDEEDAESMADHLNLAYREGQKAALLNDATCKDEIKALREDIERLTRERNDAEAARVEQARLLTQIRYMANDATGVQPEDRRPGALGAVQILVERFAAAKAAL